MADQARIKEVFTSIQGEGLYVGVKQIFIRFCGCNLNCGYCDTDHGTKESTLYSVKDLLEEINKHQECHSIVLTGGEPLLHAGFLKDLLPQCPLPVYLETNATLAGELGEIIDYIDYVAADIKLPSCTGDFAYWNEHDTFFTKAEHKELFAKIVFDSNITDDEINQAAKLCAKHNIELILQPKFGDDGVNYDMNFSQTVMDKFLDKYKKVRFIPQVHKFLNMR